MQKSFLLFCFLNLVPLYSQQVISGKIHDQDNNPLEGVNVYIEGSVEGSTTDINGVFSFTTNHSGGLVLNASYIGFQDYSMTIVDGKYTELNITLIEAANNLDEVFIKPSLYSLGKSRTVENMNSLDIVMTGSSNGDIYGALQSLPGTQKVGEDGKLYIRGGEDRETQTYIDGMHVLVPYTSNGQQIPSRSRFSPFLFKGINFSLGGYEVEYGQALSSVLPMETKDLSSDKKYGVNFSPLSIGGGGTYSQGKTSLSAAINLTNLSLYNELFPDNYEWKKNYSQSIGEFQFKKETGKFGLFKFYTSFDQTAFIQNITNSFTPLNQRSFDLDERNYYINSTYQTKTKSGMQFFIGASLSKVKSNYINATIQGDQFFEENGEMHFKAKIKNSFNSVYKLNFGIETYLRKYENTYIDTLGIRRQNLSVEPNIFSIFLDNQLNISNKMFASVSGRSEYSTYNDAYTFSPVVSLSYINEPLQISGVYGNYYQNPENKIMVSNQSPLKPEYATHYIFSTSYHLQNRLLRVEAYYKNYHNLSWIENEVYTSNGYGYSKGFDVYFSDDQTFKNLSYTLSFSNNYSKRLYKNYPILSTPTFSTQINSSLNLKYYIPKFKSFVGVTNTFSSGRPYHNPYETGYINGLTKNYHSLDMNVTFLLKKNVILYTSLSNVLGRENIYGYSFSEITTDGSYLSNPITASRKQFFYLGLFISLKNSTSYDVSNF